MDWTQRYTYNFPTLIRFGKGVIDELPEYLKNNNLSKPLFVCDAFLSEIDFFRNIVDSCNNSGCTSSVFSKIAKNPVKSNVIEGADYFNQQGCDCIIGLGGGASMDVARAIALKVNHKRDLFDYDDALGGDKYVTEEIPYFITVPTTSGTGSEVGRSTVISDDETHEKKILFSPRLMAKIVFADPELTMALPSAVTAATGIDALTHNIEAYISKGFSPMCDGIALEGIKLICESLEEATKNPTLESRSKMLIAALMGATSFQKGLGVVHSCAHPLSTMFDMHHGLANGIMLTYGLEFNLDVSRDRYSKIAEYIGLENATPEGFISYVKELTVRIGLPINLKSQGVDASSIEKLSELALKDVCHLCNPKVVTKDDFKLLYQNAL
jgi:alcohol dehydrogenase class IV